MKYDLSSFYTVYNYHQAITQSASGTIMNKSSLLVILLFVLAISITRALACAGAEADHAKEKPESSSWLSQLPPLPQLPRLPPLPRLPLLPQLPGLPPQPKLPGLPGIPGLPGLPPLPVSQPPPSQGSYPGGWGYHQ